MDAVHIVSHGETGQLSFGNATLNSDTLPEYEEVLKDWDSSLDAEADLVFYGCDLAGNEAGILLLKDLSQISHADIFASIDDTGIDGDWELETAIGEVEATSIFEDGIDNAYQYNLAVKSSFSVGLDGGGGSGSEFNEDNFGGGGDVNIGLNNDFDNNGEENDNNPETNNFDTFADTPPQDLRGLVEAGLNFSEVSPQAIATIDFNNIPAEDIQVLKQAGLSLTSLSLEALANVNAGTLKNFDYLSQIDLSTANFNELTTFGELSNTFAINANLYSYKPTLDVASGLSLDKLGGLSQSDFTALNYAYLAEGAVDSEFYLTEYLDVRDAGVNPYTQYAQNGQSSAENRIIFLITLQKA